MPWLWYIAPLAIAAIYYVNSIWPNRRSERELEEWRKQAGPRRRKVAAGPSKEGYRASARAPEKEIPTGAKSVPSLPGPLAHLVAEAGGGRRVGYYELVPKLAYVAVIESDVNSGSDYQSVICALESPGPSFVAHPLPIVEGARVPNTGIEFKKHAEFGEQYLVEGTEAKRVVKFLNRALRKALLEDPTTWLQVEGKAMALTRYGRIDAEKMEELVATADLFFAEYGAGGGPSLLDEGDDEDEEDEEEDDEEEEEEAVVKAPPKKAKAKA